MTAPARSSRNRSEGFRALRHVVFRVYILGVFARGSAVWMQLVAVTWLAVELGAGPAEVGLVSGSLFLPTLFIAPLGGVLADRVDRARVLTITQSSSAVLSLALLAVALTGTGSVALLAVLALGSGLITAIEMPVRQAYLTDLVPEDEAQSAVAIHVTAWNTTRFIGPGLAGLCIAISGVGLAFAAMALAAVIVVLSVLVVERIRTERRPRAVSTSSVLGALREGAAYAWAEPRIRWALVFLATGGIFGIQVFQTLAPLYVSQSLGLTGGAYGAFVALSGLGAVVSAYVITYLARGSRWVWLIAGSGGLAALLAALSVVSVAPVAFAIAGVLGVAQVALVQNALVTVQAATPDALRGRVMGLYVTLFQGTQPFGAFFAGWVAEIFGVRGAMLTGAALLGIVVIVGTVGLRRAGAIDALPVGGSAKPPDPAEVVTGTAP